jgi:biotin transport system substrate-specific component
MLHARTRSLAVSALLAALLAVSALISLPVGAVPFTMQTLVVVLVALVCRPGEAAVATGLYLALGAFGAPVFSAGKGGAAVLLGPTGGYLVGFVAGAVAGSLVRRAGGRLAAWVGDVLGATVVLLVVYALGASWLAASLSLGPAKALAAGVVPFLPLDGLKALGAVLVARALRSAGAADTPPGTRTV